MVNQTIVEYLKNYSSQFPIEQLKQKIISSGYSEQEVNDAITLLNLSKKYQQSNSLPQSQPNQPAQQPSSSFAQQQTNIHEQSLPYTSFKWMKLAGILGVILCIISIALFVISYLQNPINQQQSKTMTNLIFSTIILFFIITTLFYYGFVRMGKHTQNNLLKIMSWIIVILMIILTILVIYGFIRILTAGPANEDIITTPIGSGSVSESNMVKFALILFIILLPFIIFLLFSIGLIKAGNQVRFAKPAGILLLICMILSIGLILTCIILTLFFKEYLLGLLMGIMIDILISATSGITPTTIIIIEIIGVIIYIVFLIILILKTLSLLNASKTFEQTI